MIKSVGTGIVAGLSLFGLATLANQTDGNSVQLYKTISKSVFKVKMSNGWGTGFLALSRSGKVVLLTNNHVCWDQDANTPNKDLKLVNADGTVVSNLKVIKSIAEHDICVLKTDITDRSLALRIFPRTPYRFMPVHQLGFPKDASFIGRQTPSSGYYLGKENVTFLYRTLGTCMTGTNIVIKSPLFNVCKQEFEVNWTTTVTYPGNSGSPIFDDSGSVIGITSVGDPTVNKGGFIDGTFLQALVQSV